MIDKARFNYSIQSKPTVYNGCTYDSVTEARYAVFFDLLEWEWVCHRFKFRCGKYEPIEPDFVINTERCGSNLLFMDYPWRRRKWNSFRQWSDAIVEVKPTFVTRNTLRHAVEADTGPFQITALAQLAAEGCEVIVCTGSLFDPSRNMQSIEDMHRAAEEDFVELREFRSAQLLRLVRPERLLPAVISARRFKFHLQAEVFVSNEEVI